MNSGDCQNESALEAHDEAVARPRHPSPRSSYVGGSGLTGAKLAAIYRQHYPFVLRSLLRLGIDPADCEDLAQEVFVVIHRRLGSYRGDPGELRGWIYGIVRRTASNGRRGALRRRRLKTKVETEIGSELNLRGDDMCLDARVWVERVHAMVGRLRPELRDAFILFDVEDMTGPEVGASLGISSASAFRRRRAAREQLQDWLAGAQCLMLVSCNAC